MAHEDFYHLFLSLIGCIIGVGSVALLLRTGPWVYVCCRDF